MCRLISLADVWGNNYDWKNIHKDVTDMEMTYLPTFNLVMIECALFFAYQLHDSSYIWRILTLYVLVSTD